MKSRAGLPGLGIVVVAVACTDASPGSPSASRGSGGAPSAPTSSGGAPTSAAGGASAGSSTLPTTSAGGAITTTSGGAPAAGGSLATSGRAGAVADAAPGDEADSTGGSTAGDPIGPTGPLLDGGPGGTLGTGKAAGESAGISYVSAVAGPIEDIASDAASNGWFTYGGYVSRITPAGVITQFRLPGEDGGSGWGSYVTRGSDGNIWVSNGTKIDRVTPSGDITEFRVDVTPGKFFELTSGADGNLWFVEREEGKLGRLTPSGAVTEYDVHGATVVPTLVDNPNSYYATSFNFTTP